MPRSDTLEDELGNIDPDHESEPATTQRSARVISGILSWNLGAKAANGETLLPSKPTLIISDGDLFG